MKEWNKYSEPARDMNRHEIINKGGIVELIDVAGAIVLRRAEIGMSRETLAHKTGLSPTTIANIEMMKMSPELGDLVVILNKLGLKLKICAK